MEEVSKGVIDKLFGETPREDSSRIFSTGARRNSSEGKGRYDLIPPCVLKAYALRCEYGARLHGERNFELGIPNSSLFDSAMRHLVQAMNGEEDEPHLAACLWNIGMLIYNKEHNLGEEIRSNEDL